MKRPTGVTVLAYFYLCYAFVVASSMLITLIPSGIGDGGGHFFNPLRYPGALSRLMAPLVVATILATLGVGLLGMKDWSRWLAIIVSVIGAVRSPFVFFSIAMIPAVRIGSGLILLLWVWTIWYLTRPHVKMAFQSA